MSKSTLVQRIPLLALPGLILLSGVLAVGCRSSGGRGFVIGGPANNDSAALTLPAAPLSGHDTDVIRLTAFSDDQKSSDHVGNEGARSDTDESSTEATHADSRTVPRDSIFPPTVAASNELPILEALAQSTNPMLIRLQQEANAASAKTRYIDRLPDPTFGANVFGHPIETAAGSQRANLTLMQMIPWLDRLEAQQQQACFEALALRQKYAAERLRVIGDVRAAYYRLYVLHRNIETIEVNQELMEAIVEIVNARVATSKATQGDVLLGTLELSRLEEQLITLRQQMHSTEAEINRLVSRSVNTPISVPDELDAPVPGWTHDMLVQTAFERQPVIAAAQLQANAARWGVSVAELKRRPDLQIGAAWFFMDDNRPASRVVDVGRDAWSIGATVSIPLNREKYDAFRDEALWRNAASQSAVEDTRREFEARLLDLLEQAKAASETARLYQDTIIPQSEQTLSADQESLIDGSVDFDRVIQDVRNLLTLGFGYHRSVGQLATSIARIQQAVGMDISPLHEIPAPDPVPESSANKDSTDDDDAQADGRESRGE